MQHYIYNVLNGVHLKYIPKPDNFSLNILYKTERVKYIRRRNHRNKNEVIFDFSKVTFSVFETFINLYIYFTLNVQNVLVFHDICILCTSYVHCINIEKYLKQTSCSFKLEIKYGPNYMLSTKFKG